VETKGNSRLPPQSSRPLQARGASSLTHSRSSRAVDVPLEDVPIALAPHGFGAPASWFESTSRSSQRRHPVVTRPMVTFLRLHPASEYCPDAVARHRAGSPEVSRPLSATQPSRSTTPGLAYPGSRCALTLTMRLGALLPRRSPWYPFNQARSRGSPFRACPNRDCHTSQCGRPSCASPCRELALCCGRCDGPEAHSRLRFRG
jgi:hypothetical protein